MSYNLECYKNVIREEIEHYLIYNKDDAKDYKTVIKRAVYCDLLKKNISFIHEIDEQILEEEQWTNEETLTDGSRGQAEYCHNETLKVLKSLREKLMEIPRVKSTEEVE